MDVPGSDPQKNQANNIFEENERQFRSTRQKAQHPVPLPDCCCFEGVDLQVLARGSYEFPHLVEIVSNWFRLEQAAAQYILQNAVHLKNKGILCFPLSHQQKKLWNRTSCGQQKEPRHFLANMPHSMLYGGAGWHSRTRDCHHYWHSGLVGQELSLEV